MVRKATSGYLPGIVTGPVTSDDIVDAMLAAIISGDLRAGTLIHDESIARHLEISRTPVREAFLRLRTLGLLETNPSRFTRITLVPPHRTAEAYEVWVWLWRKLSRETLLRADAGLIEELDGHHRDYSDAVREGRYRDLAAANFAFFAAPLRVCGNRVLVEQIRSIVYVLRLGDSQLPEPVDLELIGRAQGMLLAAFRDRDGEKVDEVGDLLAALEIPGSTDVDGPALLAQPPMLERPPESSLTR